MKRVGAVLLAGLVTIGSAVDANADPDPELDRIPAENPTEHPRDQPASALTGANYVEEAFEASALRTGLAVPNPQPPSPNWENWLFLDTRDDLRPSDSLHLSYSGRLNFRASDQLPVPSHANIRNDLREAYVDWHPVKTVWLDAGRINLRNGVALGVNPTDFFRSRAVIDPLSADPTVLREDRLGTLMVSIQTFWERGSALMAYAPKVTEPTAIYSPQNEPSFNPVFDRTNAQNRFLVKTSANLVDGLNPEFLAYRAGNRTQFGTNLTAPVGRATVLYLEWAGGVRQNLIADAFRYGEMTGTLPQSASTALPNNSRRHFMNDLSVGATYTTENRMTFSLEYEFHEAGFSSHDWRNWFDTGARGASTPATETALWYVRSYAVDQLEPLSQHSAFFRMEWDDAFVTDLDLTALATVNLFDASSFFQTSLAYHLSRAWAIGGVIGVTYGDRRSEYGSLPEAASGLLQLSCYF